MSAQNSPRRGVLSAAAGVLGFSAIAGLLITVMVAPAVAVTGITASSAIGVFDSLPEYMVIGQQPERNEIWATYTGPGNVNGKELIATIYDQNRQEVKYEDISKFAIEAAVDGEDRRFFEHGGVDVSSVVRASLGNALGTSGSGASTLSMQLVKNIFVQQALQLPTEDERQKAYKEATAPQFDRKLKEMKLAIGLEKQYTKKEILTAYLNIAFFGDNTYGIQAAAQRYYSVDAKDLTLPQAASLLAIVQYPQQRGLFDKENYKANTDRRDVILEAMREAGDVTQKEYKDAVATPVDDTTLKPSMPSNGCLGANDHARWFCDFVVKNVKNFTSLGSTEQERADNWKKGGYKLYTTLDMDVQVNAQDQTWAYAPNGETALALGSATVTVQPRTGRVLIMTENKIFNDTLEGGGPTASAVNYNTSFDYGGSSGIQPGSTYKVFTLLDWLQTGKGLNEKVSGDARTVDQARFTDTCKDGGGWGGPYPFKNDSGESGPFSVYSATAQSINGAFISMALQLDLCDIRHVAESLGVERADGTHLETNPSSVLGTNQVTPLSMAGAYAGIAATGYFCKPIILDSVIDPNGNVLDGQAKDCHQALDPEVVATAQYAMAAVMSGGTGTASNPDDGVPVIGKTGTTDNSNQTWVMTATTSAATAVWVGNSIGQYPIRNYEAAGLSGGLLRHAIMHSTLAVIDVKYGGVEFPPPADRLLNGSGTPVPDVRGLRPEAAKQLLEGIGFAYADGGPVDSEVEAGKVATTDPAPNSPSAKGTIITVYTSKGNKVAFPDLVGDGKTYTYGQSESAAHSAGYPNVSQTCSVITDPATPAGPLNVPPASDPRDGKVTASNPAPGSFNVPGVAVTLTVSKINC